MRTQIENMSEKNRKLSKEDMKTKEEMVRTRDCQPARQVAPSLDHMLQTSRSGAQQVPPCEGRRRKLFSEVLKDGGDKWSKINLKAIDISQSPEQIKFQLKDKILCLCRTMFIGEAIIYYTLQWLIYSALLSWGIANVLYEPEDPF
jgi:hypothetical protein